METSFLTHFYAVMKIELDFDSGILFLNVINTFRRSERTNAEIYTQFNKNNAK